MQFIYFGEARFYEQRMSEFLMVSKNLEIKNLTTGIELNDKTSLNEERIKKDIFEDKNLDIDKDPASHMNEDDLKVKQTEPRDRPIIDIDSANKRVRRTYFYYFIMG